MILSVEEKEKILTLAAELYEFSPKEAQEIPGHEGGRNLVYSIGGRAFLRISTLADRNLKDYLAEVEYVHFLASEGASVADRIPSKHGNAVEMIEGLVITMFELARGDQMADHGYCYREGAPIEEYFANAGKTLGKIHAISKNYKAQHVRFDFFEKYNEDYFEKLIPDDFCCMKTITGRQIKDRFHENLEKFRGLRKTEANYGMVHFDFGDGNFNIEYDTGKINVFDFDNCRSCWYLFDIANLWSHGLGWIAWNPDPVKRRRYMDGFMQIVIEGYRSECQISDEELANLEIMVDAVLMENIVDVFEVQRTAGQDYSLDEAQCYNVKCLVDRLPWMGFYSEIFDVDAPFEVEI